MIQCPCNQRPPISVPRPKLFNRLTVLLVTVWVVIVALIVELAGADVSTTASAQDFIRSLL